MLLAFSMNASAQKDIKTSFNNDVNPLSISIAPIAGENDYPLAFGDLLRNHNVDSLLGTVLSYGVCWTGTYFVTGKFSGGIFSRINTSWVKVDSFNAGTEFRDLAFANGKIWGSPLSNTIYGINPNTGHMEKAIPCTGAASIRALTWDPVRKGFWAGTNNFTGPLKCYDTLGNAIPGASIIMPASGCYGVAYDDNLAGPYLWVSTDCSPAQTNAIQFKRYNATTLAIIDSIYLIVPLTTGAPLASGGCEITTTLIPGKRVIVSLVQGTPDRVIVVEIGTTSVGVSPFSTTAPDNFSLSQNYPNPFNPSTSIKYELAENSFVILKIFDVSGKLIKDLVNSRQNAGFYEVKFEAGMLSSGVYFYSIEAGKFIDHKKMLLIK